jgi:Protein of unknown function (DUF4199)
MRDDTADSHKPILAAGLFIGLFCGLWAFVMGFTGWYKHPVLTNAFWAVVIIEIIGLSWGLRQTAKQGRGWASQVVAGAFMAVIGGVIVMICSLLITTVFFPEYFSETERLIRTVLEQQGKSQAEISAAIESRRAVATPMTQALAAFMGTLVTGVVASALFALVIRRR